MPNRVVHFEIEAKDIDRASKFYSEAFGWKMLPQGEEFGGYIVAQSEDPNSPMGINGGIFKSDKKQYNAFRCIIGVDDINKAIQDVKKAGGKIIGESTDMETVGIFQRCEDTEGNFFGLLQPHPGEWMPQ